MTATAGQAGEAKEAGKIGGKRDVRGSFSGSGAYPPFVSGDDGGAWLRR